MDRVCPVELEIDLVLYKYPRQTFFCLRLASLDIKICPYHMTFLIKIPKQLMRSTQENITLSFILKVESFRT
jgi:hypothetical protein